MPIASDLHHEFKSWYEMSSSLGLSKKNSPSILCLKTKIVLVFNSLSIAETFKKYYPSLAENLMLKLPKPLNNFGIQSVNNYYKKCNLKERLLFAKIELDKLFKIL